MNLRALATTACLVAFMTGCTTPTAATTPSATPTPVTASPSPSLPSPSQTPSPAATWSSGQQAAIDVVNAYVAMYVRIGADPSKYTDKEMAVKLKRYLGGDMLKANVGALSSLRKNGWHQLGSVTFVSTSATRVVNNHNARGLEVHVTSCLDQTGRQIVDDSGALAKTQQPPQFNLRQFSVRMPQGSQVWRVYGIATVNGKCGP